MDILTKILPQALLVKGLPTHSEGSKEIAWPRPLAKQIAGRINESSLAILGGDIYEKNATSFKSAHENWCCEIRHGEKWADFVLRSYVETKAYLESYWLIEGHWIVFVVVEKPDESMLSL